MWGFDSLRAHHDAAPSVWGTGEQRHRQSSGLWAYARLFIGIEET